MPVARGGLLEMLSDDSGDEFRLDEEQTDAVELWFESVRNFCLGVWPLPRHVREKGSREPKPIIWTQDKMVGEVRAFPDYDYIFECILDPIFMAPRRTADGRPAKLRVDVPKPRQMFATNAILIGCLWDVLRNEATEWLIAKNKAPEAERFIKDRIRFTYNRMPKWFAGLSGKESMARQGFRTVPLKPAGRFQCDETGSAITAVSRTFGESGEAIGETAKVLLDECIRIRGLRAAYDAADAQAPVIVMVSAPPERGARIDPASLAFFREHFEGLLPGSLERTVVGRSDLPDFEAEDDTPLEDVSVLEAIH